jgi:hypothetical protein
MLSAATNARRRTVGCGNLAGISRAFRCSIVTNATDAPRAVLVISATYKTCRTPFAVCKSLVICSNQIAGISISMISWIFFKLQRATVAAWHRFGTARGRRNQSVWSPKTLSRRSGCLGRGLLVIVGAEVGFGTKPESYPVVVARPVEFSADVAVDTPGRPRLSPIKEMSDLEPPDAPPETGRSTRKGDTELDTRSLFPC